MAQAARMQHFALSKDGAFETRPGDRSGDRPAVKVIPFPHNPRKPFGDDLGMAEECYMAETFSPAWSHGPKGKPAPARRIRPSSSALLIVGATMLFLAAAIMALAVS